MIIHDYRYDPFLDISTAIAITGEIKTIPSGSPYNIRLDEIPLKESPSSMTVRVVDVLAANITTTGATSITVTTGSLFQTGDVVKIDNEQMYVSNVATNTLTVTRGYNSTTATTHTAGTNVLGPLWTEVSAAPTTRQYRPDYTTAADGDDYWNTGTIQFNSADAGKKVYISYKGTGTVVDARAVNHGIAVYRNIEPEKGTIYTALVNGAKAIGVSSIAIDNIAPSGGTFKAGQIIQFAEDTTNYTIQADVTASGTSATITISPALTSAIADNAQVYFAIGSGSDFTDTFIVPEGITKVYVTCVGGGGGGGCRSSSTFLYSSGGGGDVQYRVPVTVTSSESVVITVGAGGMAYKSTTTGNGNAGGTSSFGSYLSASGGGGGTTTSGGSAGGINASDGQAGVSSYVEPSYFSTITPAGINMFSFNPLVAAVAGSNLEPANLIGFKCSSSNFGFGCGGIGHKCNGKFGLRTHGLSGLVMVEW